MKIAVIGSGAAAISAIEAFRKYNPESHLEGNHLLIIGGGFIALLLAWAARQRKMKVTVVELMSHVLPQILDEKAAQLLEKEMCGRGICLFTGTMIERIEGSHTGHYFVYPSNHSSFRVDKIIVAAGVRPNIAFVDASRIDTEV